jgi:hypothetical protein
MALPVDRACNGESAQFECGLKHAAAPATFEPCMSPKKS